MIQKQSSSGSDAVAKAYERAASFPKSQQVDLLSQALLREFMHRHGYLDTLKTFDEECARTGDTISSRNVMRQLLNIPVQGRPSRLGAAEKGKESKKKSSSSSGSKPAPTQFSLMEELCSYRLTKREYHLGRPHDKKKDGSGEEVSKDEKGDPIESTSEDPSDTELSDLRSQVAEREAAIAVATAKIKKGNRLLQLYEEKKEKRMMEKKQKKRKSQKQKGKEKVNGSDDHEASDEEEDASDGTKDDDEEREGYVSHAVDNRSMARKADVWTPPGSLLDHSANPSSSDASRVSLGAKWCPPGLGGNTKEVRHMAKGGEMPTLDSPSHRTSFRHAVVHDEEEAAGASAKKEGADALTSHSFSDSFLSLRTLRPSDKKIKKKANPQNTSLLTSSSVTRDRTRRHGSESSSSSSSSSSSAFPGFGPSLRQQLLRDVEDLHEESPSGMGHHKKKEEGQGGVTGLLEGNLSGVGLKDRHVTHSTAEAGPLSSFSPPSKFSLPTPSKEVLSPFSSLSMSGAPMEPSLSTSRIAPPPEGREGKKSTTTTVEEASPLSSPLAMYHASSAHSNTNPLPLFGNDKGRSRPPTPPRPLHTASLLTASGGGGNRFYKGAGYNPNLSVSLTSASHHWNGSGGSDGESGGRSGTRSPNGLDDEEESEKSEGVHRYDRTAKPLQSALISSSPKGGRWGGGGGSGDGGTPGGSAFGDGAGGGDSSAQSISSFTSAGFSKTNNFSHHNSFSSQSIGSSVSANMSHHSPFASSPVALSPEDVSRANSLTGGGGDGSGKGESSACGTSISFGGRASPEMSKRKGRKVTILAD